MDDEKNLLQGSYDLHIHIAPDVVKRKCTEWEIARRMAERRMDGRRCNQVPFF